MNQSRPAPPLQVSAAEESLLHELVEYLRENRGELRELWARRITEAELLTVMTDDEIFSEVTAVYDNYVTHWRRAASKRCRSTRATCPSGSSDAASRRTKCSGSCCCCAMCSAARCS